MTKCQEVMANVKLALPSCIASGKKLQQQSLSCVVEYFPNLCRNMLWKSFPTTAACCLSVNNEWVWSLSDGMPSKGQIYLTFEAKTKQKSVWIRKSFSLTCFWCCFRKWVTLATHLYTKHWQFVQPPDEAAMGMVKGSRYTKAVDSRKRLKLALS